MLRASVTNDNGNNINVGPYLRPAEVSLRPSIDCKGY